MDCGKCPKLITVEAVARNKDTLHCGYHAGGSQSSTWEAAAFRHLTHMGTALVAHECKVLKGRYGAADFYLPEYQLIIQIDGEGHFHGHHRTSATQQNIRDISFNQAAVAAWYNLLRVAFCDMCDFKHHMATVMAAIMQHGGGIPQVLLSPTCLAAQGLPM